MKNSFKKFFSNPAFVAAGFDYSKWRGGNRLGHCLNNVVI